MFIYILFYIYIQNMHLYINQSQDTESIVQNVILILKERKHLAAKVLKKDKPRFVQLEGRPFRADQRVESPFILPERAAIESYLLKWKDLSAERVKGILIFPKSRAIAMLAGNVAAS